VKATFITAVAFAAFWLWCASDTAIFFGALLYAVYACQALISRAEEA